MSGIPAKHLRISGGADKGGRDAKSSYIKRVGEIIGSVLWVRYWKAIGHPVGNVPKLPN